MSEQSNYSCVVVQRTYSCVGEVYVPKEVLDKMVDSWIRWDTLTILLEDGDQWECELDSAADLDLKHPVSGSVELDGKTIIEWGQNE